jgi:NADP-dependent 3-hydroxy acid dehydrogenase YdfG
MIDFKSLITEHIAGKRILVTGGTTGIGRATALMLAGSGAKVMIFGRNSEQVDETLSELRAIEGADESYGLVADVADEQEVARIFEAVDSQLGGIDILINNAAIAYQSVMEGTYQDWQYAVNTNLVGYMACCHESIKRMEQQSKGHILNIGSMSADVREEDSSVYVATKSGIQGFSEALRKEVNPKGIKVTLIEPGAVDTDMQGDDTEDKLQQIERMEMLKADDIARSVVFCLAQPPRTDIVNLKIRPHLQII